MSKQVFSERFEVQELIAEGGMGAVYKVWDTKLDRVVALKVVHTHLSSDADFIERFRDEARKTARLQGNSNIVQIFDVANDHGTEYLVMEYFPSTNLRDQLRSQGKFPIQDAINVTRQIALALEKSHSCDIIHRDIKPANILLDNNQFVKLTDFGISKALSDAPLTTAGQLIGTLKYMAPEQARNTPLDGRADLYALGIVLYELITGINLWKDVENLAILGKLQAENTIPALNFPSDVPLGIQAIIQDLLRFDPTDRIQSAKALIARLDKWEDPDATTFDPRTQEPNDTDVTVVNPRRQDSNDTDATVVAPSLDSENRPSSDPSYPSTAIRYSVIAAIILLVIGGYYYVNTFPQKLDTGINPGIGTKVIEDSLEARPLTPKEIIIPSIDETKTASEEVLVAQARATEKAEAAEKARVARAKAAAQAEAAKKAEAAEKARVARAKAAAQADAAKKAEAAEKARVARAKAAAQADAADQAKIAKEIAAVKAKIAEAKVKIAEAKAAETQALNTLLADLQQRISERNIRALKSISTMSTSRQNMLENLFARYQTIETSIGAITRADDKATVILQFTRFVRPNGEIVKPSRFLKTTTVIIPNNEDGWGLVDW